MPVVVHKQYQLPLKRQSLPLVFLVAATIVAIAVRQLLHNPWAKIARERHPEWFHQRRYYWHSHYQHILVVTVAVVVLTAAVVAAAAVAGIAQLLDAAASVAVFGAAAVAV